MDRETELRLLRACVTDTGGDGAPERTVPVQLYLDPARFGHEREALFRRHFNLVAHGSMLPSPGDFITRDIVGTPALIVRGDDGRVRAFVNVCRHRGARVERREAGHCPRRFVCPYHGWTYERDGRLARIRAAQHFPSVETETSGLAPLPCVDVGGFVWVRPEVGASEATLDPHATRLLRELSGFGSEAAVPSATTARVWEANWKLLVEGGLESYHFKVAHRDTVARFFRDTGSIFEVLGRHVRSVLPREGIGELAKTPEDTWDLRAQSHILYSLFPSASVLVQEGHLELILMTPLAPDRTRIEVVSLVPSPGADGFSEKAQGYWDANHAFTVRTLDEDFLLAEEIQRGLGSGANSRLRFGTCEGALSAWHDLIDAAL